MMGPGPGQGWGMGEDATESRAFQEQKTARRAGGLSRFSRV